MCEALQYLMQDQLDLANENGIKEGELKNQQKLALKMYMRGDSLDQIADFLEVSIEDIAVWLNILPA